MNGWNGCPKNRRWWHWPTSRNLEDYVWPCEIIPSTRCYFLELACLLVFVIHFLTIFVLSVHGRAWEFLYKVCVWVPSLFLTSNHMCFCFGVSVTCFSGVFQSGAFSGANWFVEFLLGHSRRSLADSSIWIVGHAAGQLLTMRWVIQASECCWGLAQPDLISLWGNAVMKYVASGAWDSCVIPGGLFSEQHLALLYVVVSG